MKKYLILLLIFFLVGCSGKSEVKKQAEDWATTALIALIYDVDHGIEFKEIHWLSSIEQFGEDADKLKNTTVKNCFYFITYQELGIEVDKYVLVTYAKTTPDTQPTLDYFENKDDMSLNYEEILATIKNSPIKGREKVTYADGYLNLKKFDKINTE